MAQYFRYPESVINSVTQAIIQAALGAFFSSNVLATPKYNDAAVNNITNAYTEVSGVGNGSIPAGTKKLQISGTIGAPINIGIGPNSGAAVSKINMVEGGGPLYIEYTFVAGDKLFMKTLDGSTQAIGHLVFNFLG